MFMTCQPCRWAEEGGARSLLQPAAFHGCIRGMMPQGQAITTGDIVLDIPESLIISHASAAASDIVPPFLDLNAIGYDSVLEV